MNPLSKYSNDYTLYNILYIIFYFFLKIVYLVNY